MSRKLKAFKKAARTANRRHCALCGKTENLTKTDCCDQWICDDEHTYRLFSYDLNSCHRNHRRYTLCGYHYNEQHQGRWQDCQQCRKDFQDELEMYVWYGTNEFNFEKLANPPKYEPTFCSKCGAVIVLSEGGYCSKGGEYICGRCTSIEFPNLGT